ncbi:MAG: H4MPT-linked C1 transfer pathway protein [Planctomycetes bacterium]|nr:H4MPT-linked C1 transfer pathway protein [Planctomycetota bacterium]
MTVLALDIGGANIKAAYPGGTLGVPFALWRAPDRLAEHLAQVAGGIGPVAVWRVTMTAELCDCFATKREGVERILRSVEAVAGSAAVRVWMTNGRFVSAAEAMNDPLGCAAANWHALATWMARRYPAGESLLVDTGSTTTDIIPLRGGRVEASGLTDTARLESGELVYSGARRTPLMALGPAVTLDGRTYGVMAEYFATTADVHVLTGDLPENADDIDTADGRALTRGFAAARVLRMIGADLEMMNESAAVRLARAFTEIQAERVCTAAKRVASRRVVKRVIVAGSGEFLAARAAGRALPGVEIVPLSADIGKDASSAACAAALLQLEEAA